MYKEELRLVELTRTQTEKLTASQLAKYKRKADAIDIHSIYPSELEITDDASGVIYPICHR